MWYQLCTRVMAGGNGVSRPDPAADAFREAQARAAYRNPPTPAASRTPLRSADSVAGCVCPTRPSPPSPPPPPPLTPLPLPLLPLPLP
jgi:hypothetical protein